MIYFIKEAEGEGLIKIGFTSGASAEDRLKSLQTANPRRLFVLAATDGNVGDERALHNKFAKYRVAGEWFKPVPELLAFINGITWMSERIWADSFPAPDMESAPRIKLVSPDVHPSSIVRRAIQLDPHFRNRSVKLKHRLYDQIMVADVLRVTDGCVTATACALGMSRDEVLNIMLVAGAARTVQQRRALWLETCAALGETDTPIAPPEPELIGADMSTQADSEPGSTGADMSTQAGYTGADMSTLEDFEALY